MELNGKIAIVTGGGNGIGRGIAMELAGRGAKIVLGEIVVDAAEQVAQEINSAGGDAIAVGTDVTDQESTGLAYSRPRSSNSAGWISS